MAGMYDFSDITGTSKEEQIRAYSLEQAIESFGYEESPDGVKLIDRATLFEDFITNGKSVVT